MVGIVLIVGGGGGFGVSVPPHAAHACPRPTIIAVPLEQLSAPHRRDGSTWSPTFGIIPERTVNPNPTLRFPSQHCSHTSEREGRSFFGEGGILPQLRQGGKPNAVLNAASGRFPAWATWRESDFSEEGNPLGSHFQPNLRSENIAVEGNHPGSQLQPENTIVDRLELFGGGGGGASLNSSWIEFRCNRSPFAFLLGKELCPEEEILGSAADRNVLLGEPNRSLRLRSALNPPPQKK